MEKKIYLELERRKGRIVLTDKFMGASTRGDARSIEEEHPASSGVKCFS